MLVHLMQTGEDVISAARSVATGGPPEHTHTLCVLTTDDAGDEAALDSPAALDVSSKFSFREQWQKFDGAREQLIPGTGDTGDAVGYVKSMGLCPSQ